jgi:hypothetical protein
MFRFAMTRESIGWSFRKRQGAKSGRATPTEADPGVKTGIDEGVVGAERPIDVEER